MNRKTIVMTQGTSQLRLLMCTRLIIPLAQTLLKVWFKQNFELIHVFMALHRYIYKSQGAARVSRFRERQRKLTTLLFPDDSQLIFRLQSSQINFTPHTGGK